MVVSHRTTSGIPGLVGETASIIGPVGKRPFRLLGYHAARFSPGTKPDGQNYDSLVNSGADHSSPLEPLMAWADLLLAGIRPTDVQLLGINGGDTAAFEMRFALAMGARVGVV